MFAILVYSLKRMLLSLFKVPQQKNLGFPMNYGPYVNFLNMSFNRRKASAGASVQWDDAEERRCQQRYRKKYSHHWLRSCAQSSKLDSELQCHKAKKRIAFWADLGNITPHLVSPSWIPEVKVFFGLTMNVTCVYIIKTKREKRHFLLPHIPTHFETIPTPYL